MDPANRISPEKLFQILYKNFPQALKRLDQLASTIILPPNENETSRVVTEHNVAPSSPAFIQRTETDVDQTSNKVISDVQTRTDNSKSNRKRKRPIYLKLVNWKPDYTPKPAPSPKRANSLLELFQAVRAIRITPSDPTQKTSSDVQEANMSHISEPSDDESENSYRSTEASHKLDKTTSQPKTPESLKSMMSNLIELLDFLKSFDNNELNILSNKLKGSPEERVQCVIDHISIIDNINNYEFPVKTETESL